MEAIDIVKTRYPELTSTGFAGGDALKADQVQTCIEWLLGHDALCRRHTINTTKSSYVWKHKVERGAGKYVSNGAFICAALYLKYRIKRQPGSPNAYFNIRNISLAKE